jgi:hypothetical protein
MKQWMKILGIVGASFIQALLLTSCDRKVDIIFTPSKGNLLDTAVIPTIITTFPVDQSTGPYSQVPGSFIGPETGDCIIDFSKAMLRNPYNSSVNVSCPGWHGIADYYISATLMERCIVSFYDSGYYYSRHRFHVGALYMVTIDTSWMDVTGKHLERDYSFHFTPEPAFRIIDSYPADGDTILPGTTLSIRFNSVITSSIIRQVSFSPPATCITSLFDRGYGLNMSMSNLHHNTWYIAKVEAGAQDTLGHILPHAWGIRFYVK